MNIPILQMKDQETVSNLASTKSGVDQFYSTLNIPASATEFSARSRLEKCFCSTIDTLNKACSNRKQEERSYPSTALSNGDDTKPKLVFYLV